MSTKGRRNILLIAGGGLALLIVGVASVGVIESQKEQAWQRGVGKVSSSPVVTLSGKAISFRSDSRAECDTDNYQKYDRYLGTTTDWDAYRKCEASADVAFDISVLESQLVLAQFADEVAIPESFSTRLSQLRGLDGTQQSTYDTEAGELQVTYSYDGLNGVFVQIERIA